RFYQLQFNIARRSLLDVLNAEKELSDIQLLYVTTSYDLRNAMLDYMYSQGTISSWVFSEKY
ncbi:TolC family protein, partial [Salmonella enterica subsp. enterica serovar Potsdam]|nr:TolC family protein [Salmonella enterica subsp. enterica serovar Potsdam]EDT2644631.1 TolC family protein [Salmonella enterica subsp. enterica serovar Abony]EDY6221283.1 TolC family protein [Salmonella enterica]